ncbi:MAG: aldo/keto reductase [Crocinitomicaceae bacterium]|nr:aldo/keto reductase [Crocinitomicaceae bacterium]
MAEYCIGTAQFGMHYGIANKSGQPELHEINKIVKCAIKNNIQYFDTAQSYGESETVLGEAFSRLPYEKNFRVISKLSPDLQKSSPIAIVESVRSSLKKLNMNSLYGFLAHRVELVKSDSFITAIEILKKDRLVIKTGVSVYTPEEALNAMKLPEVDILQIPFNILDRRWIDEGIIEKAQENNIQLFFRSIFLQGLIFLNENELISRKMEWANTYINQLNEMVKKTSFSAMDLTFGLLTNMPGDNVIIMGMDNSNQLQENLRILEKNKIDKKISDDWWSSLPVFPEKLLNPSLWN